MILRIANNHDYPANDHSYFTLIMDCKHLFINVLNCPKFYVPRTCNKVAHNLISLAGLIPSLTIFGIRHENKYNAIRLPGWTLHENNFS